ncbi:amine acid ABC transporter, permease protein, 3-TM region, His/Glu/Gln/Arg/opine family [Lachnospiraceae bacterium JC7]|nr:amine acid ABC transporter, permease protein, 3-TM region, His/Glu/Gln/Arg/opine family [Lachnospiraceae bacterium JC7]
MRPFHPLYIIEAFTKIVPFIPVTLATMAGTVLIGGVLGLLLAVGKLSGKKGLSAAVDSYIYIVRCIPPIVLLFIVYYGLPELLKASGININDSGKWFFVITTFSVLFSATMAEVFRTSYEAVDKGQREAALASGLTEFQAFRRIVAPQALIVAIPNFTNALVKLMKEGSLSYTIGMIDVMGKGQLLIGMNQGSYGLETYIALALIYWTLTVVLEKILGTAELNLSRGKKNLAFGR